jgi:hypothetical protein
VGAQCGNHRHRISRTGFPLHLLIQSGIWSDPPSHSESKWNEMVPDRAYQLWSAHLQPIRTQASCSNPLKRPVLGVILPPRCFRSARFGNFTPENLSSSARRVLKISFQTIGAPTISNIISLSLPLPGRDGMYLHN